MSTRSGGEKGASDFIPTGGMRLLTVDVWGYPPPPDYWLWCLLCMGIAGWIGVALHLGGIL